MKFWVWICALAIVVAAIPLSIGFSHRAARKGDAAAVTMMVGLGFVEVFDPKAAAAVELIQSRKELEMTEEQDFATGPGTPDEAPLSQLAILAAAPVEAGGAA